MGKVCLLLRGALVPSCLCVAWGTTARSLGLALLRDARESDSFKKTWISVVVVMLALSDERCGQSVVGVVQTSKCGEGRRRWVEYEYGEEMRW